MRTADAWKIMLRALSLIIRQRRASANAQRAASLYSKRSAQRKLYRPERKDCNQPARPEGADGASRQPARAPFPCSHRSHVHRSVRTADAWKSMLRALLFIIRQRRASANAQRAASLYSKRSAAQLRPTPGAGAAPRASPLRSGKLRAPRAALDHWPAARFC